MDEKQMRRRLPIGAEVVGDGVWFRVWAPSKKQVEVVFPGNDSSAPFQLTREDGGYFSGHARNIRAGMLYQFRLDGADRLLPDPASRFQPRGPDGPSQIIDPSKFRWTDQQWKGVGAAGQALYEIHIGTFTKEGTYAAAMRELPSLAEVGVTCLEMMPLNEFTGRFGWGYDGVDQFAPFHHYGSPDDLRALIDRAHAIGIGIILDVVYNHFGAVGNYMAEFAEDYFTDKYKNDWGRSINFDDRNSGPVREFFLSNARYWIEEFHVDGFRFDATQAIIDSSPKYILAEITELARKVAAPREVYLINENEPQDTIFVRAPQAGGYGMDALWNDDFHHSAMVVISGHNESYYTDYLGSAAELVASIKFGYLYQGQRYKWQEARRGTPALDLPPTAFVNFLQNHDQIANSGIGLRAHRLASPATFRAMTSLMLLAPQTPMLFQGQEFAASSPFFYFADHDCEISEKIRDGRMKEMSQFPSLALPGVRKILTDPCDPETFERSKLDHSEKTKPMHAQVFAMHKELLKLRRGEPTLSRINRRGMFDAAVLGDDCLLVRYFDADGDDDRLLIVNFGSDQDFNPAPQPLLAPPRNKRWSILFSSEDPRFGGAGTPALETENEGWRFPGRCAVLLSPLPIERAAVQTRIVKSGSVHAKKE